MMKKVSSMMAHTGVIGLALLALLIATLVWLFERAGERDPCQPRRESEEAALPVRDVLEDCALESGAPIACTDEAAGDGMML
jgi:hypothetical protein